MLNTPVNLKYHSCSFIFSVHSSWLSHLYQTWWDCNDNTSHIHILESDCVELHLSVDLCVGLCLSGYAHIANIFSNKISFQIKRIVQPVLLSLSLPHAILNLHDFLPWSIKSSNIPWKKNGIAFFVQWKWITVSNKEIIQKSIIRSVYCILHWLMNMLIRFWGKSFSVNSNLKFQLISLTVFDCFLF